MVWCFWLWLSFRPGLSLSLDIHLQLFNPIHLCLSLKVKACFVPGQFLPFLLQHLLPISCVSMLLPFLPIYISLTAPSSLSFLVSTLPQTLG